MVVPLFYSSEIAGVEPGASFTLSGDEGKHAATVRRMRVGEPIQVTNGLGLRISGTVTEVNSGSVVISVTTKAFENLPELRLTLVQALAKGDRDELAVQAATELGAIGVIPWQALRSVSRWDGPKQAKGQARWQTIASEAAKQSLRVFNPKVEPPVSTKELASLVGDFDTVLILDPTASTSLVDLKQSGKVAIVVGPEGGIDESELRQLESAGAKRVHLGSGILRTSTAGLAAISYLVATGGHWNSAE